MCLLLWQMSLLLPPAAHVTLGHPWKCCKCITRALVCNTPARVHTDRAIDCRGNCTREKHSPCSPRGHVLQVASKRYLPAALLQSLGPYLQKDTKTEQVPTACFPGPRKPHTLMGSWLRPSSREWRKRTNVYYPAPGEQGLKRGSIAWPGQMLLALPFHPFPQKGTGAVSRKSSNKDQPARSSFPASDI